MIFDMKKRSIRLILSEMKVAVEEKQIISPTQWIDWALELNTLQQDLKTEMIKAEIQYKHDVWEFLEADEKRSHVKAETAVQCRINEDGTMTSYEKYRYLTERDKLIEEFIMLAKKRATIEQSI